MQALHLWREGWKQRDIAMALDVTEWAQPLPGAPAKLTPEQKPLIPDFLWHGAEAYGFRGEFWSCLRIAKVLRQEFGVSYSKSQIARLLKQMRWTPQIPIARAIQRDEAAIARWRAEMWPELKKRAQREHRMLIFIDESGFYLTPGVVRTYAPRGPTPVLREWQTWDHLSIIGGITPHGKIRTLVRQESLNGLHVIAFLQHLLHTLAQKMLVIGDGSPIHRRTDVKQFVASYSGRTIAGLRTRFESRRRGMATFETD